MSPAAHTAPPSIEGASARAWAVWAGSAEEEEAAARSRLSFGGQVSRRLRHGDRPDKRWHMQAVHAVRRGQIRSAGLFSGRAVHRRDVHALQKSVRLSSRAPPNTCARCCSPPTTRALDHAWGVLTCMYVLTRGESRLRTMALHCSCWCRLWCRQIRGGLCRQELRQCGRDVQRLCDVPAMQLRRMARRLRVQREQRWCVRRSALRRGVIHRARSAIHPPTRPCVPRRPPAAVRWTWSGCVSSASRGAQGSDARPERARSARRVNPANE